MSSLLDFINSELKENREKKRERNLDSFFVKEGPYLLSDKEKLLDFSSNDYLNLSLHPLLKERSKLFIDKYSCGATASRLVSANNPCYEKIEKKIATLKQTEDALLFCSGYQANSTILPSLANKDSLLILDRLCHRSLYEGALASRAKILRFHHNDLKHLENLLETHTTNKQNQRYNRILIITESLFGMDGDVVDALSLETLAKKFNALLYVDEAHATGVLGKQGSGLFTGNNAPFILGTFGKAFGCFGAFFACSKKVKQYLINFCPGIIYSTALPPSTLGAIDAALDLIPSLDKERDLLQAKGKTLKEKILSLGIGVVEKSSTHILPILTKKEEDTLRIFLKLKSLEVFTSCIRPPTVPVNSCRIRIALTSAHTDEHIDKLLAALKKAFHEET